MRKTKSILTQPQDEGQFWEAVLEKGKARYRQIKMCWMSKGNWAQTIKCIEKVTPPHTHQRILGAELINSE